MALWVAGCGGDSESALPDARVVADAGPIADARPSADAAADASGTTEPSYQLTGDVQQTAVRGGDGGNLYQLICRTGYVAVGLRGSSGTRIDTVELACRELLDDGRLGDELYTTARAGADNDNPYEIDCPDGRAIVGFRGREDSDIRAIGVDCAEIVPWIVEGRGHELGDDLVGDRRGREFVDLCSRGFFVTELVGQHSDIIHGLSARCARAEDVNDRTPPGRFARGTQLAELPPRGGPESRTDVLECADDELPIGFRGLSSNRLVQLQLICGRLAEDGSLVESGTSLARGGTSGDSFEEYCPVDEAIAGLRGGAGTQIDSLGLVCAPVAGWVIDGTGLHPWGRRHGGGGGDDFDDPCPQGSFLRDIQVNTNGVVEALTGRCVAVGSLD